MKLSPREFSEKVNNIIKSSSTHNAIRELKKPNPTDSIEDDKAKKKRKKEEQEATAKFHEEKRQKQIEAEEAFQLKKAKILALIDSDREALSKRLDAAKPSMNHGTAPHKPRP